MEGVYIGVGSNLAPETQVPRALALLAAAVTVRRVSTFYRTAPWGGRPQPAFINGVVEIATAMPARQLKWDLLRGIEAQLGRQRGTDKYAARPIDLDLLVYASAVYAEDDLIVPDPEIPHRPFLAIPLHELAPALVLPGDGRTLEEIVAALPSAAMEPLPAFTAMLRAQFAARKDQSDEQTAR